MAEWLGHAGNVLRRAVEHREQIERLTKEHGPDESALGAPAHRTLLWWRQMANSEQLRLADAPTATSVSGSA